MYRLLAIDLDGTLLKDDKSVAPENMDAMERAKKAGLQTAICSGRALPGLSAILADLKKERIGQYHIGLNGGLLYDGWQEKIVASYPMGEENAKAAIELGRSMRDRFNIHLYTKDTIYVEEYRLSTQVYERANRCRLVIVPDLMEYAGEAIKIIYNLDDADGLKDNKKISALCEEIKPLLPAGMTCYGSCEYLLEVLPRELNKGKGLANLAAHLNMDLAEVAAIGDNANDIPMLETAGLAIAVANAEESIQKICSRVTKRTNNQGAVAEAIAPKVIADEREITEGNAK